MPRVLSIAGTDPTGGAGIQADLKSIAAGGGYGMAVVTALVAQNTRGVREVHTPPVSFLAAQLDAVSDDVAIDAVKIGMLGTTQVIATVAAWLDRVRPPVVVLDPVMVATSGDRLLDADAEDALRTLCARADLVTPNIPELAILVGEPTAVTWPDVLAQARRLSTRHGVAVLAKGGHLGGADAPDALVTGEQLTQFAGERVATSHTHGTGCSLSSGIAVRRAAGAPWERALDETKRWLTESLRHADELAVGTGHGPVHHFAGLWHRGGLLTRPTPAQVAAQWWTHIGDIRAAIDELPFVRALGDGSLRHDAFTWYLAQDALYLRAYSRVLAQASALAPDAAAQEFWAAGAYRCLAAEAQLHESWVGADEIHSTPPGAATTAYLDHLAASAARGDYAVLVAAVLPCYWIYRDVGERLHAASHPRHPYRAWLDTYADPEFAAATTRAIDIATRAAADAGDALRARMRDAFTASARHEWAFFAAPLAQESADTL
ncbi:bifunctional hydroxymethylpyrimidine kinase/phosphomethylpyrimidine kinase [Microbacterium protaetiae]|uniref:Bifunctional hydroxymethylpyrimidine kinase/phosphomethylpyrimidine kinase n=1 Tax=Microbacterium protaetiae TaxID=2509458 RepID=A0A4P6EHH5_9MICO|nr:bifunctional hydroxymethylpyrimidine kinase/phosphomethylpyrimidine kinase [Microbacterium protaetiae]